MAIENAKKLNVRIRNKYDSYENWMASGLTLEAGEIAIAYTSVDVTVDGGKAKHPALLMKVGDGASTFAQLPWLSAKAADVLSVCKNETELTAFVNGVIANAGIATDEAMQALTGRVTTTEGAIDALEALVGTDKVADQIAAAIAALNLNTTYAAKEHKHVKADITDFAHNHEMTEINGLVNVLAGKETAGEGARVEGLLDAYKESNNTRVKAVEDDLANYKTTNNAAVKANADAIDAIKDHDTVDSFADVMTEMAKYQLAGDYATKAEAQAMADGKDEAIAAAKKAGDDAQADVDALAGKVGSVAEGSTVVGMIEAVDGKADDNASAIEELEKTHGTDKKALEDAIALKADKTALDAVSAVANAAVKQADYDVKVKALEDEDVRIAGLVSAEAERAAGVEADLEERLVEVETFFKTADGETIDQAMDTLVEIQKYITEDGAAADQMVKDIAANKKAIEDHAALDHDFAAADATLKSELEGKINAKADASIVTNLETALDARLDVLEAIDHEAYKAADTTLKSDLEGQIALKADASVVTAMDAAYKAADTEIKGRLDVLEAIDHDAYKAADTALKNELTPLIDAKAAQTELDALEALVGTEKVADQIDAKIEDLDLANTYEAKGTAETLNTAMDARVAKLEALDFILNGDSIVLDCGDSK